MPEFAPGPKKPLPKESPNNRTEPIEMPSGDAQPIDMSDILDWLPDRHKACTWTGTATMTLGVGTVAFEHHVTIGNSAVMAGGLAVYGIASWLERRKQDPREPENDE